MRQQSGNVGQGRVGQLLLTLRIEEGVLAGLRQRHVAVHAGAVLAEDWLRHEGCVHPVLCRDGAHDITERGQVVGACQCIGVTKADLVLADRDLVVRDLNVEAQLHERVFDGATDVLALVDRTDIEVPGLIVRIDGWRAVSSTIEDEELSLGANVHREAHLLGLCDLALQGTAGVASERRAVGLEHVADDARHVARIATEPWQDRERADVGAEVHVGLLNTLVPTDRRAVEHHLVVECLAEFLDRNRNVFQVPIQLGELQPHEADIVRLALGE